MKKIWILEIIVLSLYCNQKTTVMVKLIEKGACIWIYEIEDAFGRQLPEMEIVLGEDILKSDDNYMNINGNMFVTERDVEDAIIDYMSSNYPEVHDYMCDLDDE